jgi:hypothetical protein
MYFHIRSEFLQRKRICYIGYIIHYKHRYIHTDDKAGQLMEVIIPYDKLHTNVAKPPIYM